MSKKSYCDYNDDDDEPNIWPPQTQQTQIPPSGVNFSHISGISQSRLYNNNTNENNIIKSTINKNNKNNNNINRSGNKKSFNKHIGKQDKNKQKNKKHNNNNNNNKYKHVCRYHLNFLFFRCLISVIIFCIGHFDFFVF